MKTFTVFGIYADNMQRHSDNTIQANNPDQAEQNYRRRMSHAGHDMLVAAVLPGSHTAVESFTHAEAQ